MLTKRLLTLAAISMLSFSCAQSESGIDNGTGGDTASGGGNGSGGATSSGGNKGSGGSSATGGSTGNGGTGVTSTGGTTGQGGSSAKGGATGSGGTSSTGGATGTGGTGAGGTGTGGHVTTGTGGATGSGGAATGGSPGTGGATGSGGATATGGTTGQGGSSGAVENSGSSCNPTAAALLSADNKKMPNPFAMHNGTVISSKSQWECRRNEVKADLEKYEIGPKQDPSTATVKATLSGKNLTVAITTSSGSMNLTSAITGSGSCVYIVLDSATGMVSGCTTVPFTSSQVVKSEQDSTQYQSDPFYKVYPSLWGKIGNYSAWAWGVSRLIDGLAQVASQLNIDMTKIAVHGCSYAGKMSLFSGALDERVALTIVEESGGGGINSWRMSQEYTDRSGVQVEKIDNTNYGWFMPSMQKLDAYKLPHDHHELVAMIAPRAVIILGNDTYQWLGDESGYKSTMAALQVFTALGVPSNIGYDFTSNHNHCAPPTTQMNSVTAYANKFFKGGTTNPSVAIKPPDTSFDLNWQAAIDWTTPTLQ